MLKKELKDAEREREVLRDAYESQRLRLREFERRLLQLEDRKDQPLNDLTARDAPQPKQSTSPSLSAMRHRLRALPVVMVKRDPPPPPRASAHIASKKSAERQAETTPQKKRRLRAPKKSAAPVKAKARVTPTLSDANLNRYASREGLPRTVEQNTKRLAPPLPNQPNEEQRSLARQERSQRQAHSQNAAPTELDPNTESRLPNEGLIGGATQKRSPSNAQDGSENRPTLRDQAASLLSKAKFSRAEGQREKATRLLRRMISEFPTHALIPEALYQMGLLQIEQGDETLGRSTLLRLSRLYPTARAAQAAKRYLESEGS